MIGLPLVVSELHKTYAGAEHPVFDGFSLEVEAGCLCAIVGVSGVGKTTLLNCVAALDHWTGGSIKVGEEYVPLHEPEAASLFRRRHVGLAFQQPHLLPEFTVLENLLMPVRILRDPTAEDEAWGLELLALVGLFAETVRVDDDVDFARLEVTQGVDEDPVRRVLVDVSRIFRAWRRCCTAVRVSRVGSHKLKHLDR